MTSKTKLERKARRKHNRDQRSYEIARIVCDHQYGYHLTFESFKASRVRGNEFIKLHEYLTTSPLGRMLPVEPSIRNRP